MTRNRVLIAGAFFVLALLVLLPLWQPREKAEIQDTSPEVQAVIPEAGRYELAPSTQSAVELPSEASSRDIVNTVTADPQKKTPRKPKPAEVEPEDPGYDSVDPGLVQPPPKLPPAEQLDNMQRRGIVAY
ncbi:MAG: hypothetical protein WCY23_04135 [Candidatus Omnitrophota bacterium]